MKTPVLLALQQGSEEWKEYKKPRIGGSDATIIMGMSDYMSPFMLFQQKKELMSFAFDNPWTQKGTEVEPIAREFYNRSTGSNFKPLTYEAEEHPWMMASLDGIDFDKDAILEIKCPKAEVFDAAKKKGIVHEIYKPQVQHQLYVTGAECCHFLCVQADKVNGEWVIKDSAVVIERPDELYQKRLIEKELEFLTCLQTNTPPPLSKLDKLARDDEPHMVELYSSIREETLKIKVIKESLKKYEESLEAKKQMAIKMMKHTTETCCGVTLTQVITRRLHERLIAELGIDVESVKKESISYRLTVN